MIHTPKQLRTMRNDKVITRRQHLAGLKACLKAELVRKNLGRYSYRKYLEIDYELSDVEEEVRHAKSKS